MATGDQTDIVGRLKAVLPAGWLPPTNSAQSASPSPVLDTILNAIGWMWSQCYALLQYTKAQGRIATATDVFLDIAGQDYFGNNISRKTNETDSAFRARITANLLPPANTRAALIARLEALTGNVPSIFEPQRPADTGGYNTGYLGWGVAGGWGNLDLPFQSFVIAYRPVGQGIATVQGFYDATAPYGIGGWNTGALEYASLANSAEIVTDADIYAAIAAVIPAGTIAWARITQPNTGHDFSSDFSTDFA